MADNAGSRLDFAKASLGDLSDVEATLRDASALVARAFPRRTLREIGVGGTAEREALKRRLEEVLSLAQTVLERLNREPGVDALSEEEQSALEAVVALVGRPALLVTDGGFEDPPPQWQILDRHRAAIARTIAATGRIEDRRGLIGTGFLVGPSTIMTNRHVALEFCRRASGKRWSLGVGGQPQIDLRGEWDRQGRLTWPIVDVVEIWEHPDADMALLAIDPRRADPAGCVLPPPLRFEGGTSGVVRGAQVYVVGYPASDNGGTTPNEVLQRIFADVYGVKRLQPGEILAVDPQVMTFAHDCSTLGGNSGSPVVQLETNTVVGLHFSGAYMSANRAVLMPAIRDEPMVRKAGLEFADGA